MARFLPDRFVQLLLATTVLAIFLPVRGQAASIAGMISSVGIFMLFLMNGLRLPRDEVMHGIRNWKLQSTIYLWVFGAMGLAGVGISLLAELFLPSEIVLGFLYLGVLPSTVQSATAYNSLAGGNVAASVVASALLNLTGVVVTPLLFAGLAHNAGISISSEALIRICLILLLPFALGQILQNHFGKVIKERKSLMIIADRTVIALAVYVAFSGAVAGGTFAKMSIGNMGMVALGVSALLVFGFVGNWLLSGWMHFARADRKTILFSGAQKSISVGAPLATILFPPAQAGTILFPLLIYHLAQLIVSAPVASRLARH